MLAAASPFENENGKIAFNFIEIAAIPIPQLAFFVKESNCPPLARFVYQFGTLDRLRAIENTLEVCVAEPPENRTQLKKKATAVLLGVIRARYHLLTLDGRISDRGNCKS